MKAQQIQSVHFYQRDQAINSSSKFYVLPIGKYSEIDCFICQNYPYQYQPSRADPI